MTRTTKRVVASVAVGLALFTASVVFKGQPTIYRLERLLDRNPTEDEVLRFLERNDVPHSLHEGGRKITASIDVFGVFDPSRIYRISLGTEHRVTSYTSDTECVAP
jgi:hypothetical protein